MRYVFHTLAPSAEPAAPVATPIPTPLPTPASTSAPTASPSSTPAANLHGPQLALIVDDCGQWIATERGFVALDIPLTLSVLPDVPYTSVIATEASDAGKGVMLHLPMETLSGLNPGPGKVTTEMSDAQIVAQVQSDLAEVPLARGVNNHEGSRNIRRSACHACGHRRARRDTTSSSSTRRRTQRRSERFRPRDQMGVPTAARDVFPQTSRPT